MKDLNGKKVLLFTSVLFNYHIQIKNAIEQLGAEVHLYDERNNPTSLQKILIRKARFLMKHRTNSFYSDVAKKELGFNPDYILFVSPEAVTKEALIFLRSKFPNSVFILYMWDSLKNKHVENILDQFDRRYSFDSQDCRNNNLIFRPLFFSPDFNSQFDNQNYEYDLCFIGTVHSDRAKILLEIKNICDENDLKYYFYLFIPSRLLYVLRIITDKYLRKWDKQYVHTYSLAKEEVAHISSKSRCIIDINHPSQTGLTMRTIEMIGLNRKLATTNSNIQNYDFFRPENQIVLDRKNLKISKDMIQKKYCKIPEEIYRKYSIQYWVKEIFDLDR